MFRIALEGINIGIMVGTEITSEVLQRKLKSLQNDLDHIHQQLAQVGIDLKSGAEFFQPIVKQLADLNFKIAEVDVFTAMKVEPLLVQIQADGKKLVQQLVVLPDPNYKGNSSTDWMLWLSRALTLLGVAWSGKSFGMGIRKFMSEKKRKAALESESEIDVKILSEESSKVQEEVKAESGVENDSEKIPEEQSVKMEGQGIASKAGVALDGIVFIFGVAALIMNIVQFVKNQSELEKQIDAVKSQLQKAKEDADKVSTQEAAFFRDIPSIILFIQSQFTQVIQIATYAKLLHPSGIAAPSMDTMDRLLAKARYSPFTEEELKLMQTVVSELDKDQQEADPNVRYQKIQGTFKKISTKIPNKKFLDAFQSACTKYDTLDKILVESVKQFDFIQDMVTAITALQELVKDTAIQLNTCKISVGAILHIDHKSISDDELLTWIALFTSLSTFPPNHDLSAIRARYPTVDPNAWTRFVDSANQTIQSS